MDLSDERWRHRVLTNGPRGCWVTVPGSHTQLFDERICFDDDGMGRLDTHSVLRGHESLRFRWRMAEYAVVECQPVYDAAALGDDGEPESSDWFRIAFSVEPRSTDAGTHWALREKGTEGFWELTAPLIPQP
jgi:hypothetical protein